MQASSTHVPMGAGQLQLGPTSIDDSGRILTSPLVFYIVYCGVYGVVAIHTVHCALCTGVVAMHHMVVVVHHALNAHSLVDLVEGSIDIDRYRSEKNSLKLSGIDGEFISHSL